MFIFIFIYSWFHGYISKQDASSLLLRQPHGAYMLHFSDVIMTSITLTYVSSASPHKISHLDIPTFTSSLISLSGIKKIRDECVEPFSFDISKHGYCTHHIRIHTTYVYTPHTYTHHLRTHTTYVHTHTHTRTHTHTHAHTHTHTHPHTYVVCLVVRNIIHILNTIGSLWAHCPQAIWRQYYIHKRVVPFSCD